MALGNLEKLNKFTCPNLKDVTLGDLFNDLMQAINNVQRVSAVEDAFVNNAGVANNTNNMGSASRVLFINAQGDAGTKAATANLWSFAGNEALIAANQTASGNKCNKVKLYLDKNGTASYAVGTASNNLATVTLPGTPSDKALIATVSVTSDNNAAFTLNSTSFANNNFTVAIAQETLPTSLTALTLLT